MNRSKFKLAIVYMLSVLGCPVVNAQLWPDLIETIRKDFPTVQQLSTSELSAWLQNTNKVRPCLIDTRAKKEFEMSHLQGALHADSLRSLEALKIDPQTPVVLYCSVGYRSSKLATAWMQKGRTNLFNLEGSIFAWANEGRPVYQGSKQVHQVHPYDKKWGKLLNPELLPK